MVVKSHASQIYPPSPQWSCGRPMYRYSFETLDGTLAPHVYTQARMTCFTNNVSVCILYFIFVCGSTPLPSGGRLEVDTRQQIKWQDLLCALPEVYLFLAYHVS